MPTFGSLFSGIGGIDLGLERAGWECRWQVEWDEFCQRVLAHHWPDVTRYGDITTVDWSGVEPVDLIAGGFPCQPISDAGKRLAQADERWLWPEFARAVGALRPRFVFVENVAALLGRGLGIVLGDLAALGYDAEWDCLPAYTVGAPHERDRLWLVAYSGSLASERGRGSRAVGGETAGGQGEARKRQRVRDAARGGASPLADAPGDGLLIARQGAINDARPAWTDDPRRDSWPVADATGEPMGSPRLARELGDVADTAGAGRRHAGNAGAVATTRGRSFGRSARSGWRDAEPRVVRAPDGVPAWLDGHRWPAPPGPQHEWEPPRLAPRGIPNRGHRVKALGNAVVPQIPQWIGERLMAALDREDAA